MRDNNITILKAFAIILVVMAHAASPLYLSRFSYMIGVSLFFVASGFFFKVKYLTDEATFVKRRLKGLYVPFVKWSVILLILHNLWFRVGILSEHYGNAAGGVTHPLSPRQWMQSLWSIITNMSGYDVFIGGAYWFFRALLVSSIVFLILFKLLSLLPFYHTERAEDPEIKENSERFSPHTLIAATIAALALGLALWMTCCNLRWTGLSQGGYRELMGIFFLSTGYLYNRFYQWLPGNRQQTTLPLPKFAPAPSGSANIATAKCRHYAVVAGTVAKNAIRTVHRTRIIPPLLQAAAITLFVVFPHPSMATRARSAGEVLALAASGIVGFALMYNIALIASNLLCLRSKSAGHSGKNSIGYRILLYIGDNTIYVFGWHLLAFKLASMAKVAIYGLPWEMVGGHPVVHSESGTWFWVVYTIVGVSVPLLCLYFSTSLKRRYFPNVDNAACLQYIQKAFTATAHATVLVSVSTARLAQKVFRWFVRFCKGAAHYTAVALSWTFGWVIRSVVGFWNNLVDAIKSGTDTDNDD